MVAPLKSLSGNSDIEVISVLVLAFIIQVLVFLVLCMTGDILLCSDILASALEHSGPI